MNKQTQHIFSLSDAVDCMRQIPDNSIQLIIADPPYNINKATWDKIKDYTNWAAKWIEESYRILKLTGNLVIFGGLQYRNSKRGDIYELMHYIRHHTDFKLRNVIIWYYKSGTDARRFFSNRHEEILWFNKSNDYIFNLDAVREKYTPDTLKRYQKDKRLDPAKLEKGKNPTNVWEIPRLNRTALERVGHPTQKPSILIERIVKSMSNEGDMILDPFCGSGVTFNVCVRVGRNSIICDNDPQTVLYIKRQQERLQSFSYEFHDTL